MMLYTELSLVGFTISSVNGLYKLSQSFAINVEHTLAILA